MNLKDGKRASREGEKMTDETNRTAIKRIKLTVLFPAPKHSTSLFCTEGEWDFDVSILVSGSNSVLKDVGSGFEENSCF